MAQRRVEAVFSGRDAGLSSMMQNLRRESSETAREMIDQATSSSDSAREAVRSYEDQIRAMERRNRVASQSNRLEIDNKKASRQEALNKLNVISPKEQDAKEDYIKSEAQKKIEEVKSKNLPESESKESIGRIESTRDRDISDMRESSISLIERQQQSKAIDDDYKNDVSNQKNDEKEQKLQVEVLKEILDAIKVSSRREISSEEWREGKESAREDIRVLSEVGGASDLSNRLNEEGKPAEPIDPNPKPNEGGSGANIVNAGNRFLGSRDVVEGSVNAGGAMGMLKNPYVALAAAVIGATTIGTRASAKRETAAGKLAGISGATSERISESNIGTSKLGEGERPIDYGLTREEFLSQKMPEAARSMGTVAGGISKTAIKQVQIEKGLGLDSGTSSQLDKFERLNEGNDAMSTTKQIIQHLRESGQLGESGNDMTKLNEYIRGFIAISEQNLSRFGTNETEGTKGTFSKLSNLGGNFDREDYTVESTRRLDEGLRGGSSEAQAMKMNILRQQNPEMGRFELDAEMEKGINSKGFLDGVMKFIKNAGGNEDTQSQLLDSMTGGQMRKGDIVKMIKSMNAGELDFENVTDDIKEADIDVVKRAKGASSTSDTYMKLIEERMTDITSGIGTMVQTLEGALTDFGTKLDGAVQESRNADR